MYCEIFFTTCPPPSENVSEHLQIQGSEVQDSHQAIVKDLADVRHQAQDIYQKIGKENLNSGHNCKNLYSRWVLCLTVIPLWLIRARCDGVPAVPGSDLTVLHGPDEQAGAHEQHSGVHAALPGEHAGPGWGEASCDPGLPGLGRWDRRHTVQWLHLSSFSATKELFPIMSD